VGSLRLGKWEVLTAESSLEFSRRETLQGARLQKEQGGSLGEKIKSGGNGPAHRMRP